MDSGISGSYVFIDDLANGYIQFNSVVAGSSITARMRNLGGGASTLKLYINGVLKDTRAGTVSASWVDVVFNYATTAGNSVKIAKTTAGEILDIDYIKVQ